MVEVGLVVGLYLMYRHIRFLVRDRQLEAFANAADVVRWEQALGIFHELSLQRRVLSSDELVAFLGRYYATAHFPVTVAVVLWIFVCHRRTVYPALRFLMVTVTLSALVLHVVFPLAPPRMMNHLGFVDTLAVYGPDIYSTSAARSTANQFAAMPSLHFGWAVIVAWAVMQAVPNRWGALAWLHPAITLLAITATANHYWLDSIVALALIGAAFGLLQVTAATGPAVVAGDRRTGRSAG